jgi:hypothetical protein
MVPRQIQELRNALCPRCGTANDVAVMKCHQCGEALPASAHLRTEASNDSVPDAMFDEAVDGSLADPSFAAPPDENPIASPEDSLVSRPDASPPDAPQRVQVPAGFTISFEPDPSAPDRDRYTVKIARSTEEPVTAATLVAADSAHAAFESFTAELRSQFSTNGAFVPASPAPERFSRAAMLEALRTSMSSRGAMVAGAVFVAGLAAVAYLLLNQRPSVDLSRFAIPTSTSQGVDLRGGRDTPLAPVRLAPVEAALAPAVPSLNQAESPAAAADSGPTRLLLPDPAARRIDPPTVVAPPTQPVQKVKPPPAPSLAHSPVVVPPKPAGGSAQAPSSTFGPCTAGVAALGLCTLQSAAEGN